MNAPVWTRLEEEKEQTYKREIITLSKTGLHITALY
jgi:hypothetical protein